MATKKKTTKKNSVATTSSNTAVAEVMDYGDLAGQGYENVEAGDYAIPFLNLIQDNSPQCKKAHDKYMDDAEEGMYLNSASNELYKEGVYLVPVHIDHCYVEWGKEKEGGGFIARHELNSPFVAQVRQACEDPRNLETDKTELNETYYLYALVLNGPEDTDSSDTVVLSFSRTKIKKFRNMMTMMRKVKGKPPLFANRLYFTHCTEVNKAGKTFANYTIEPALTGRMEDSMIPRYIDGVQNPLIDAALALKDAVSTGSAQADHAAASGKGSSAGSGGEGEVERPF